MPGTAAASMAVLGSFTVVAAFTAAVFAAANTFTRHFAAVDFIRAFMASVFMIMTAFTTTTTFVDLSSSAALRSALG
jgi:hypothetical protein